jgi:hypothetical protein
VYPLPPLNTVKFQHSKKLEKHFDPITTPLKEFNKPKMSYDIPFYWLFLLTESSMALASLRPEI